MKYQDTQKKVGDLMGGKVLDLDIIKAHDAGLEETARSFFMEKSML